MIRTDLPFWSRLWSELGLRGDSRAWHARLMAAYTEPQRRYHNEEHLAECLSELDGLQSLASQPRRVGFALWFHDAMYEPCALDNEEKSADLAQVCLAEARAPKDLSDHVRELILATKTHQPKSMDAQVLCDADLAILGQPPERFWRYEQAIASEYAWVPPVVYRAKRAEVLERFLARPVIFHTALARGRYERAARVNLTAAITRLRAAIA